MVVLSRARRTIGRHAPLLLATTLLLASCSWFADERTDGPTGGGPGGSERPELGPAPLPDDTWPTATPAEAGLDATVLADVARHAREQGTDCFLVARDGRVVLEETWRGSSPDDAHGVFSVTKSIASTLVGIAVADGSLALDDRVSDHVAAWRDPEHEAITVRQVLNMTTGLARPDRDYFELAGADDRTGYALGLGVAAEPGTTWAYSNGAVQVLDAVLEEATGMPTAEFAQARLLGPLGMDRTELFIDAAGNASLAFGAVTTCRDLARLGLLVLADGRWGDEQLVAPGWFAEATASSSELNEGYGLLWWLNREGRRLSTALAVSTEGDDEVRRGRQVPGAPQDLVWALGLGDQILQVHPGTGTIVVRIGRGQALDEPNRFDERATARVVTEGVEG